MFASEVSERWWGQRGGMSCFKVTPEAAVWVSIRRAISLLTVFGAEDQTQDSVLVCKC